MKKIISMMLAFASALLSCHTLYASKIPNNDHPNTFLGPTLRGSFTNSITDTFAYSLALELGLRNDRVSGTIGWELMEDKHLKISAEFLRQNITYPFFDSSTDQWLNQGAMGANYQYDMLDVLYHPQFTLSAYVAYSPSKDIGTGMGTFVDTSGMTQTFTDYKRLAGAKAGGVSPGMSIFPWKGGSVGADLNYDVVHYRQAYAPDHKAVGFGGTLHANQYISEDVQIQLLAAVLQPYIHYQANLLWGNISCFGKWQLGVNTDFIRGKKTLPDTYNVGLSADYFLDQFNMSSSTHQDAMDTFLYAKDNVMLSGTTSLSQQAEIQRFLSWTAEPAIYMPQILAIPDEKVTVNSL